MVKPHQVLFTLLAVGGLCALLMLVFPAQGIKISDKITLKFAQFDDFFDSDTIPQIDVKELLKQYEVDSTAVLDSIANQKIAERQKLLWLQYPTEKHQLPNFYKALIDLKKGKRRKVRVLHYGDSQIEGDRITSFVRDKLQSEFGGNGPGMLPAFEFVPNFSVQQSQSSNWIRYTAFGKKDTTFTHKNFGLAATFSRFTPYQIDSTVTTKEPVTAWVKFSPSKYGYGRVRKYSYLRMYYGNFSQSVHISVEADGVVIHQQTLDPAAGSRLFELPLTGTPKELTLTFTGVESPDVYGISLESGSGVVVDNFAMRGSSGTVFTQMSTQHLASQYGKEPISLVILQYGGNTVPYIKSKEKAEEYGRWFGGQIAYLKKLLPNADFIVIGPSDMATKVGTQYVTMDYLTDVRDALRINAHKQGAAYWDIFEVMGGRNSMAQWVEADPPLAAKDYVHFTPQGAKYIAELFYKALHRDFDDFKKNDVETAQEKESIKIELEPYDDDM